MVGLVGGSDLARNLMLRRNVGELKASLARHSQEFVTGRVVSPVRSLKGDVAGLSGIEHGLATLSSQATVLAETAAYQGAQQRSLDRLVTEARSLAGQQLSLLVTSPVTLVDVHATMGRQAFVDAVATLNSSYGGRGLFSGAESAGPALAPAQEILDALVVHLGGVTAPADVEAAVMDWFLTPGGGFDTTALTGSVTPAGPVSVAPGETVELTVTAARDGARRHLAALALGALASEGPPGAGRLDRIGLIQRSGAQLIGSPDNLIALGAELGAAEARVAAAQARNGAEALALELARKELIGVDEFDSGTRLDETRARIEAIFALTGRLQRLSLVEYLR